MIKHLKQLASESLVYGLAGVLNRFVGFLVLIPIYTRLLTVEQNGIISLVTSTFGVIAIFAVLGLDNSAGSWYWATQDENDRKQTIATWAWTGIVFSCLLGAGLYFGADAIATSIFHQPDTAIYLQILAPALPLSTLTGVLTNWLRFQRRPWPTAAFGFGITLLTIAVTLILLIPLKWGLRGIFWAQVASAASATVIAALFMRSWISPRHFSATRLKEMLKFGLPMIPAGVSVWIVASSSRYFVNQYQSTSEVGLFGVGSSLAGGIGLATAAFQQAWGPFALSNRDHPEAHDIYANALPAYLWVTCLMTAMVSLLAPEIIQIVATRDYLKAGPVVGILAMGLVMHGTAYIAATGPSLARTSLSIGAAVMLGAVVNICLNFLMIPRWGMWGAGFSTLIAQSVTAGCLFWAANKVYPIPYRYGASLVILGVTALVLGLPSLVAIPEGTVGYAIKLGLVALFIPLVFVLKLIPRKAGTPPAAGTPPTAS